MPFKTLTLVHVLSVVVDLLIAQGADFIENLLILAHEVSKWTLFLLKMDAQTISFCRLDTFSYFRSWGSFCIGFPMLLNRAPTVGGSTIFKK